MQSGIAHTLGWSRLRPVQELAIEPILAGHNCVVLAPTAGGKTEAAFFPVLDLIYRERLHPVSCLYISPLRALLNNQEPRIERLAGLVGLSAFKWHGDVSQSARRAFLEDPADVLLITPESLEVMLISPKVDKGTLFADLRFVVVDEVHAFAADDRGAHLVAVLERIQRYSRHDIQRVGLSATVGNPEEIGRWLSGSSRRPLTIVDPSRPPTEKLIEVYALQAEDDLGHLVAPVVRGRKALFFTESRRDAEAVGQALAERGVTAYVHHSSVGRHRREEAEDAFTLEEEACIVCTSTMELGIDVGDLDVVLQLDAPGTVSSFMQRLGRTGRRPGSRPHIVFLAREDWTLLLATALVNLARRGWIEPVRPSRRAVHILVHQILAQALQYSGVRREQLWEVLQRPACFSQVNRAEFDTLIDHLVATDILYEADGLLTLGPEGEARFGRRNFLALFSVFETPQQVTVVTTQHQEVGTLETWFVQAMEIAEFVFVLAGRRWRAVDLDLDAGILIVEPARAGQIPRWSGSLRLLSREVAQEHRAILMSNERYPFLHRPAQARLDRLRAEWRSVLAQSPVPIRHERGDWVLHTFAGGRINTLLARALAHLLGVQVTNDNFTVRLARRSSSPLKREELMTALRSIAEPGFFSLERLRALTAALPRGRLSKFQDLLPPELEAQFLAERLFDPQGVQDLLQTVEG
jgi:ATP-dependent Lhr-like helicase